jgi:hypothetical protein
LGVLRALVGRVRENPREAARRAGRRATAWRRPLPDFLVIGEAKCGTTSLFAYLSDHPLVCPPTTKELRYFAFFFDRGEDWYRAFFPSRWQRQRVERSEGAPTITGEATPLYLSHPSVPPRAASVVPQARLVAILRNPVERALSAYDFRVKLGTERRPLAEAIDDSLQRAARAPGPGPASLAEYLANPAYVTRGEYARSLGRWFEHFDRSQLLVIETEQLSRDGGSGFARVLEHLALPPWRPPAFPELNPGTRGRDEPEVRSELARHYVPHNEALWGLLGVDWGWNDHVP